MSIAPQEIQRKTPLSENIITNFFLEIKFLRFNGVLSPSIPPERTKKGNKIQKNIIRLMLQTGLINY